MNHIMRFDRDANMANSLSALEGGEGSTQRIAF
jgi:hypothetical protein